MSKAAKRVVVYARISNDSAGQGLGVARQQDWARDRIEREGWTWTNTRGVDSFDDNDISAFKGAKRPEYDAMMKRVEEGEVDVIVVSQSSRLWRNRRERAEAIEVLAAHKVKIAATQGVDLDLSTASGRMMAGLLGEFDTAESAIKSERIVAQKAQMKQLGAHTGGHAPYGFRSVEGVLRDGKTTGRVLAYDPDVAPLLLSLFTDYAAGAGAATLCKRLNGSTDRQWFTSSMMKVLFGGAAFGRIPVRDDHMPPADQSEPGYALAAWEPIPGCDDVLWRAMLAERARRRRAPSPKVAVPQWLLGGLVTCGECGSRCVTTHKADVGGRVYCRTGAVSPGTCSGRGSISRTHLENQLGIVLMQLGPELLDAAAPLDEAQDEVVRARREVEDYDRRVQEKRDGLARLLASGITGDMAVLAAASDAVQKEVEALLAGREEASERLGAAERRAAREALWAPGGEGPDMLADVLEQLGDGEDTDTGRWQRILADVLDEIRLTPERIIFVPKVGEPIERPRPRRGRRAKGN